MAKADAGQHESNQRETTGRVFKSKDVHKRRRTRAASTRHDVDEKAPRHAPRHAKEGADLEWSEPDGADAAPDAQTATGASYELAIEQEPEAVSQAGNEPPAGGEADEPAADPDENHEGDSDEGPEGASEEGPEAEPGEDSEAGYEESPEEEGDTGDKPVRKKRKLRIRPKHVVFALLLVLLIAAVAVVSMFAWERWGRYDDMADMQGEWYARGSIATVSIEGDTIQLSDDVSYVFQIDDHAKTISYTFGPLKGQGRYWFSPDRSVLAIIDGEGFTDVGNLVEDLGHSLFGFPVQPGSSNGKYPVGDGVILLDRKPGVFAKLLHTRYDAVVAEEERRKAKEQAEAERKAAEEAEAEAALYEYY